MLGDLSSHVAFSADPNAEYVYYVQNGTVLRTSAPDVAPVDTGVPAPFGVVAVNNDSIIVVAGANHVAFHDKATGAIKGSTIDVQGQVAALIAGDTSTVAILRSSNHDRYALAVITDDAATQAQIESGEPTGVISGTDFFFCAYEPGWAGKLTRLSLPTRVAKLIAPQNESDCPIGVGGEQLYFYGVGGIRRVTLTSLPK
jgi:hypothetical protein